MSQDWDIKPCNAQCSGCGKSFEDQEPYLSELIFREEGYHRADYCASCREKSVERTHAPHSVWKGVYRPPPPPSEEILKKDTAESLLRKLMDADDDSKKNLIYVLAVMLERKKILVEKNTRKCPDGMTTIVFEHRKTGESFLVPDPHLRLDELEHVQTEVTALLGTDRKDRETKTEEAEDGEGPEESSQCSI